MIRTFAELGLDTGRVDGRSGVWLAADGPLPERKIAAIGIRVSANVTMHGLAINVSNDLAAYDAIVPCGITDAGVTTVARELGDSRPVPTLRQVADLLQPQLADLLSWQPYTRSPDIVRAETPAQFPQLTAI